MNMECSGGGFWHTDYLTGDEYYSMAAEEVCDFTCSDPLFILKGLNANYRWEGHKQATCRSLGKLNLQFDAEDDFISCEPNYCIFPSFGKGWFDRNMDGTRVQIGVECSDGIDNGDHVIARVGEECQLVCKADNGKSYRVQTQYDNIKCHKPIPA